MQLLQRRRAQDRSFTWVGGWWGRVGRAHLPRWEWGLGKGVGVQVGGLGRGGVRWVGAGVGRGGLGGRGIGGSWLVGRGG